ncbi:DUF4136 domain-containing protein [Thalassotalea aquiviva]|uniref:DUF4136 domain-containing protein n=1 Tax=Thalassotalea aquiviva TaxID=3242415 RepID=UPI00352A46C6
MLNNILKTVALFVFVTGCSTTYNPEVDFNPEYNFNAVQSYHILATSKTDPTTDNLNKHVSDLDHQRLVKAIDHALERKSMVGVDKKEEADVWVKYLITSKDKTQVRTYNTGFYNCWHCRGTFGFHTTDIDVRNYVEGTVIIDFIDPKSNRSIWRAVESKPVKKNISVNEKQAKIQLMVDAMLASFKSPTPYVQ